MSISGFYSAESSPGTAINAWDLKAQNEWTAKAQSSMACNEVINLVLNTQPVNRLSFYPTICD